MVHSQPQRIVMGIHARLKIRNRFRSPGGRIEHRAHRHADDEVRSQIVNAIRLQHPVLRELILNPKIELLYHRVLQPVVDDVHAFLRSAGSGNDEACKSIGEGGGTGSEIPEAGGAQEGMNVIDNRLQNPMVQQFNLGVQYEFAKNWVLKADGIHNLGTHFIIGVPVGAMFNPASGGPETVTDLQSSVNTHYDALWLTVDHRFAQRYQLHAAYTLSKASNYANYDQVPFGYP